MVGLCRIKRWPAVTLPTYTNKQEPKQKQITGLPSRNFLTFFRLFEQAGVYCNKNIRDWHHQTLSNRFAQVQCEKKEATTDNENEEKPFDWRRRRRRRMSRKNMTKSQKSKRIDEISIFGNRFWQFDWLFYEKCCDIWTVGWGKQHSVGRFNLRSRARSRGGQLDQTLLWACFKQIYSNGFKGV